MDSGNVDGEEIVVSHCFSWIRRESDAAWEEVKDMKRPGQSGWGEEFPYNKGFNSKKRLPPSFS
jgi:hypothetical protein